MAKISKALKAARSKVEAREYTLTDAIKLAQETTTTKFDATVEVALKLNLDTTQADQQLRGAISLPNGTGKTVRVLAIVSDKKDEVKAAGADFVEGADVISRIQQGWTDFDVVITEPKMMAQLGRIGRILGPKGLMPNPKTGTVTMNVADAVQEFKKGKVEYRTDKFGNIHLPVGKVSFDSSKIEENVQAVVELVKRLKPASVKGTYIQNAVVSTTMGPSVKFSA